MPAAGRAAVVVLEERVADALERLSWKTSTKSPPSGVNVSPSAL
jgi:hypothetical protein